ncbi:P-loop containing nucleoside triphosphate hydrolase protein [Thamnocephalis sphaerospora]|uniref:Pre-mRNA-splicing factor n=1 Tax=Thamnocephalis sphaerospora TaxID=78915 RepID=A0A4P9XUF6_9FUNG|nr:P-loop containing nucleoside triphosphate hydrolase protein [Thamnocephalis sphaerospora]|eukprot:RKP09855.1 P-loop containing nucleoside triphosphate hydrolase protein [Thamnocephalis sphaerospora]
MTNDPLCGDDQQYLWPNYRPDTATDEHVLSLVAMVNEKCRQRVSVWDLFSDDVERFGAFFRRAVLLSLAQSGRSLLERERLLLFLGRTFQSLENVFVRNECMRLVSVGIWHALATKERREAEMAKVPHMVKKVWRALEKRFKAAADEEQKERIQTEWYWISWLISDFMDTIYTIPEAGEVDRHAIAYCERFLEFAVDLLSQLPTRRFVNALVDDHHVVLLCKRAPILAREPEGYLAQLLDALEFFANFEVDEHTGRSMTAEESASLHNDRLLELQRIAYADFREQLPELALTHLSAIETQETLREFFRQLTAADLDRLCDAVNLRRVQVRSPNTDEATQGYDSEMLVEALVYRYKKRTSQLETINQTSLYPDETLLFDDMLTQTDRYTGDAVLPLPRLNLQFLTLHDYLLRAFKLFRLESAYEIRQDIEDAVRRLAPQRTYPEGQTVFAGWARMATPVQSVSIVEVAPPLLGEERPSRVRADIKIDLGQYTESVQRDWDMLRPHDIVFLLTVRAKEWTTEPWDETRPFCEHFGLDYVRGCEVTEVVGAPSAAANFETRSRGRTIRVLLDPNRYYEDVERAARGEDVNETFNILLRRNAKENNFKAVLETVRDLMQSELFVPDWLQNVFLGYGDPASAHYRRMPNMLRSLDFRDTFVGKDHLQASFPEATLVASDDGELPTEPPYVIDFVEEKREAGDSEELVVKTYQLPNMGPYASDVIRKNAVPFTPSQVEAIRAGSNPGLTLIVGPPGTGKTDVAVQIISNIYHNFPQQRTLLIARSNQALNQLFEKIVALDIDDRHLLRLGHGEEELETEESFNKAGRVSSFLERRIELLGEVSRLALSLGLTGDHGYTCETAGYFYLYHVLARWEPYEAMLERGLRGEIADAASLVRAFPFSVYFSNVAQPLFSLDCTQESVVEIARGCFRHIKRVFEQLEEIRAFELLRTSRDRANYLLTKEARVVAMTTMHAALKRRELVELGFKYDNVIMEEAAQMLEGETFIPLLMQEPKDGRSRLKRVVLIGDHHQLPPVVQNPAFERYCNMEQSMFTRFVRLGVPTVELDRQGRARPSIAKLYNWRYKNLGDLPNVVEGPGFQLANPGFSHEYQFINVEDYEGRGETAPSPHFFQNLGEAEYVVATYQYMRLLGYPAERITILTTYNGQRALIGDVLRRRCSWQPYFGMPAKVTTVDKYQGQQNDYILLSLVRTKHVGYLRDVRRLTVAMSRARLGLYVFGRLRLFAGCVDLKPTFDQLAGRPTQLCLQEGELYGETTRKVSLQCTGERLHFAIDLTSALPRWIPLASRWSSRMLPIWGSVCIKCHESGLLAPRQTTWM